jgi:hypothetical protein
LADVLQFALAAIAALAIPIASAFCASQAKLMSRPGPPSIDDSAVAFDLLVGAGAFAATILVEALSLRVAYLHQPAPEGFTGAVILALSVFALVLLSGYWLAGLQRNGYEPTDAYLVRAGQRQSLYELSPSAVAEANRLAGAAFAAVFVIFWQQSWLVEHILNPVFSTR